MSRLRQVERALLSVALVLLGLGCVYGIYVMVFMGPSFSVERIVVEGKWRHLGADILAEQSGVSEGDNLFMLSVSDVHDRLKTDPWVKTTAVRRMLPDTLWIYVEEEEPVAVISDDRLTYVAADGRRIKEMEAGEIKDLPVFTAVGCSSDSEVELCEQRIDVMVFILDQFRDSGFGSRNDVSEINYDAVVGYSIVTKVRPMRIILGHTAYAERIARIDRMIPAIAGRPGRIKYMIANEKGRVVVGYGAS
jgi:cell division protein FtsQ